MSFQSEERKILILSNFMKIGVVFLVVIGFVILDLFSPFADYRVEASEIERIEISYKVVYFLGENEKHYTIERKNGTYYTDTGVEIDSALINNLVKGFTGFYESSEYEIDLRMTDFYPQFTVVITYSEGTIVLRSESNCHCFIPWNIEYTNIPVEIKEGFSREDADIKGETFVQYNGVIPTALLRILLKLDDYWSGYEKFARWGCYSKEIPEKYIEKGFSPHFPEYTRKISPEEKMGASHVVWSQNVKETIAGPPLYADEKVFVPAEKAIYCFDALKGEKIWETQLEDHVLHTVGVGDVGEYVTYMNGRLFVTGIEGFYCLDVDTGKKMWEVTEHTDGSPLYWENRIYLRTKPEDPYTTQVMGIICLDAASGVHIWEYTVEQTEEYNTCSNQNMLLQNGKIYFGTGEPSVYCVDAESGKVIWKYTDSHVYRRLIIFKGNVLMIEGWGNAQIVCLNNETGKKVWETYGMALEPLFEGKIKVTLIEDGGITDVLLDIQTGNPLVKGDIYDGIFEDAYLNGILYTQKSRGELVALDIQNAEARELWSHTYDEGVSSVHAFEQGILVPLVTSGEETSTHYIKTLLFLDKNGILLWEHYYQDMMYDGLDAFIEGDILLVTWRKGFLEAFDVRTGKYLWKTEVQGNEITDMKIRGDNLYICANDGKIYCLALESGRPLWIIDSGSGLSLGDSRFPPTFFGFYQEMFFFFTEDGTILVILR
ncbi:MAG: PQQ-binding-like beta-propeller repeat protein [Theionarchaea archaeon]|nr:PQQ-binding-like beta-propeller repeat protein [Theionarchaea archaeon]